MSPRWERDDFAQSLLASEPRDLPHLFRRADRLLRGQLPDNSCLMFVLRQKLGIAAIQGVFPGGKCDFECGAGPRRTTYSREAFQNIILSQPPCILTGPHKTSACYNVTTLHIHPPHSRNHECTTVSSAAMLGGFFLTGIAGPTWLSSW